MADKLNNEGHADPGSPAQSVGKGQFYGVGTYAPLKNDATSVNSKAPTDAVKNGGS